MKKLIYVIIGIIVVILAVPLTLVGCNNAPVTADDFELTISVEQTTFSPDDWIFVDVSLTNLSGRRVRISYVRLFHLSVPDGPGVPPPSSNEESRRIIVPQHGIV
ncbi:MAG: hypothetical protein FWE31_05705 [Firmicutes bacterium]|nr:hypothetical protein [Bacillota bacterium]